MEAGINTAISNALKEPAFNLPTSYTGDFYSHAEQLLNNYLNILRAIDPQRKHFKSDHEAYRFKLKKKEVIKRQEEIVGGLIKTIDLYLQGHTFRAYNCLDTVLKQIPQLGGNSEFSIGEHYRAAILTEEEKKRSFGKVPLERLFHIPFEKRGIVKNHRYSISGVPSLYLSGSLYTCAKEINWDNKDRELFYFIQLREKQRMSLRLRFLNIDWDHNTRSYSYKGMEDWHLLRWPLVAMCNIKVKNQRDTFKPEYIVPQLVYQWVNNNHEYAGIKYNSTHIDPFNSRHYGGGFYNLALATKDYKRSGFCSQLASFFETTQPMSIAEALTIDKAGRGDLAQPNLTRFNHIIVESIGDKNSFVPYTHWPLKRTVACEGTAKI
ncbi:MAG: hypothetical protein AAF944_01305 [Bacteroidota bacterium]